MKNSELIDLVYECIKKNPDKLFLKKLSIIDGEVILYFSNKKNTETYLFLRLIFNIKNKKKDSINLSFGLVLDGLIYDHLNIAINKESKYVKSLTYIYLNNFRENVFYVLDWSKGLIKHINNLGDSSCKKIIWNNNGDYGKPMQSYYDIKDILYALAPVFEAYGYTLVTKIKKEDCTITSYSICFKPIVRIKRTLLKESIKSNFKRIIIGI